MPEAQPLALLRRNIDREPEAISRVLTDAALRKTILGGIPKDEKKAIKAFAAQNAENALKTKPKVCLDLCQCQQCSPCVLILYFDSCVDFDATRCCSMQTHVCAVGAFRLLFRALSRKVYECVASG